MSVITQPSTYWETTQPIFQERLSVPLTFPSGCSLSITHLLKSIVPLCGIHSSSSGKREVLRNSGGATIFSQQVRSSITTIYLPSTTT